jgi:hypothetical protein
MQRNNLDYTYLVIYTIFLGWNLLPLDLLWNLLAFSSHLVEKRNVLGLRVFEGSVKAPGIPMRGAS